MHPKNINSSDSSNEIDVVRRIYWFEGLRIRAGVDTAYALERKIEPESFSKNQHGDPTHRNKWSRYKRGKHTPNKSMIAQANGMFPGSARELNHELWQVLKTDKAIGERSHGWLKNLDAELLLIIFEDNDHLRMHGGRHFLGKLERRASMDCLACLVILLRLNTERGAYELAWEYAHSVFRVLLMLGLQFEQRKLGETIFKIFIKRVFSLVRWHGYRFHFDGYDFVQSAHILYSFSLLTKQSKERQLSWEEQVSYMCKVFAGNRGFDLTFSLEPITVPDNNVGPLSEQDQKEFDQRIQIQNWGSRNLLDGRKDRFPPVELLKNFRRRS